MSPFDELFFDRLHLKWQHLLLDVWASKMKVWNRSIDEHFHSHLYVFESAVNAWAITASYHFHTNTFQCTSVHIHSVLFSVRLYQHCTQIYMFIHPHNEQCLQWLVLFSVNIRSFILGNVTERNRWTQNSFAFTCSHNTQ